MGETEEILNYQIEANERIIEKEGKKLKESTHYSLISLICDTNSFCDNDRKSTKL